MSDPALLAPSIFRYPDAAEYRDAHRLWQGIPSIEHTSAGRVWATWYSGMETERGGNFVVVVTSDDRGHTWDSPRYVVHHADPSVRCYDPCLWLDPRGRLWLTWNQSREFFDGRCGVWASICDKPGADDPQWGEPRRIANGIMMNKPVVTTNGAWLFPAAIWSAHPPTEEHGLQSEMYSNVYVTRDEGATFELLGSADVPNRQFDEHMIVERRDGTLWMLVRCYDGIGESFSDDGGHTWSPGRRSQIDGPCSRFHIRRLPSGRLLMINHDGIVDRDERDDIDGQGNVKVWKGRTRLTAFLSEDDGATWPHKLLLDDRDDVSYPDAGVAPDGTIFVVYDHDRTGDRGIYMAKFSEEDVVAGVPDQSRAALGLLVNRAGAIALAIDTPASSR